MCSCVRVSKRTQTYQNFTQLLEKFRRKASQQNCMEKNFHFPTIKHGGGCRSIWFPFVCLCYCPFPHHQVCLSLLGTWAGPGWDPNHSTLLQDRRDWGQMFFWFQTHMEISRVNLAKCYMIFDAVIFRKILKGMGFQLVLRAWALVFAMYRGIWTCMAEKSAIADAYLFQGCSNWHTKRPNTIV